MGFLTRYTKGGAVQSLPTKARSKPTGNLWRQVFGTDKESGGVTNNTSPPIPTGAGWPNSAATAMSQQRLLQALRSKSPGGWSDNRYEQAAHYVGITYVSIFRLARMMGQAEFQVFQKDPMHPDGKRAVSEIDPPQPGFGIVRPYDLVDLLKRPNPIDSFGKMLMRNTIQKYLTGTALNWMVPNPVGSVAEIYPIETAIAQPQPVINPEFPNGFYRIQPLYPNGPFSSYPTVQSAIGATIPAEWMLTDRFPHPFLRYEGYSPLTAMNLHIDEVESMDKSRWHRMKRSIKPNAILQMTEIDGQKGLQEEEIERIRAEWESEFQGPHNWGKILVGYPGFDIQLQNDQEEVDYYNGWEQLVSFVMGGFGITKEAAGMISDASYAALFATLKQLQFITLDPECQDISQNFTENLAPFFGRDLVVEVRCKRIDDHEITFQKMSILQGARAITKNEVRKAMEFPVTAEPWGNDIAGDPSPAELVMQTAQFALPDQPEEQGGMIMQGEEEPPEIAQTRPDTGDLGKGSKGPQDKNSKSLQHKNRILDILNKGKALANGNGRH